MDSYGDAENPKDRRRASFPNGPEQSQVLGRLQYILRLRVLGSDRSKFKSSLCPLCAVKPRQVANSLFLHLEVTGPILKNRRS